MSIEIKKPPRPDWCFSHLPEEELTACIFWEYARESPLKALGPKIRLEAYTELNAVHRRLIQAVLTVDGLEVRCNIQGEEALRQEGFFQEIDAWQDLSGEAKDRFQRLFGAAFVWSADNYGTSHLLLEKAFERTNKEDSSGGRVIVLTDESLMSCSDDTLLKEMKKCISDFRGQDFPSKKATRLRGLFGEGVSVENHRAFLSQLGAYRLLKNNRAKDLMDAFYSQLCSLESDPDHQDKWLEPATWSKAKKNVEERIRKWFPLQKDL